MSGKHYRTPPAETKQHTAEPKAQPKKEEYEDLYSYEEPYGAKRGTRQSTNRRNTADVKKTPEKKESAWLSVIPWLCLLAAAGILGYIVWDLGLIEMVRAMLG